MSKVLMKGNEAIAEAAVRAGCLNYFAYPITPQSEIGEYLAHRLPEAGGMFLQAESEIAVVYMLYGAAGCGARAFTSSSSPGISLMSEGISYLAGAQLPVVFVNIMRGGPGLGGILPSQADYFQAVKGAGHGDCRMLVLAPASVQEAADMTAEAFELADKYRNPVMVLGDGLIGQMMEPVSFKENKEIAMENKNAWAPTTMPGQRTTTSPFGRDVDQMGMPVKMAELLAALPTTAYVTRQSVIKPRYINRAKKAIRKAFELQMRKVCYSFVEVVSTCPTNWGMTPLEAVVWTENTLLSYYPIGDCKSPNDLEVLNAN
jgi:pyruvate/2-oxoacid:ferredoxin oxidoreductase alpha subunit